MPKKKDRDRLKKNRGAKQQRGQQHRERLNRERGTKKFIFKLFIKVFVIIEFLVFIKIKYEQQFIFTKQQFVEQLEK